MPSINIKLYDISKSFLCQIIPIIYQPNRQILLLSTMKYILRLQTVDSRLNPKIQAALSV